MKMRKIFINGKLVIELPGYVAEYKTLPLDDAAKAALQVGSNVLAVHCRQTGGGQFIDVHLIDARASTRASESSTRPDSLPIGIDHPVGARR
jgi:hypothetical protein